MNTCRIDYTQRNRLQPGTYAGFLIRFSGWNGSAVYGKLWSAYSEDPVSFAGLEDLLQKLEDEMDAVNCPARTFAECAAGMEAPREREAPQRQTYPWAASVKVYRRRNGELQGELQICGSGWRAFFRSGEEFMALIGAALGKESA